MRFVLWQIGGPCGPPPSHRGRYARSHSGAVLMAGRSERTGEGGRSSDAAFVHRLNSPRGPWYVGRRRRIRSMIARLPIDLERFVQAAVQSGRFASPDEAIAQAVRLLRRREE